MNYLLILIFIASAHLTFAKPINKNKGVCPEGGIELCQESLEGAVSKLLECNPSNPDIKQCARIFVNTLSEADDNAPFFEGMADNNSLGNVASYKKTIALMKQPEADPQVLLALYDFSKAIILQETDFVTISPEDLKKLEELVKDTFPKREFGRSLSRAAPRHRKDFINFYRKNARTIIWPDIPQGTETKRILK